MRLMYPRDVLDKLLAQPRLGQVDPSAAETIRDVTDGVFFASLMVDEDRPVRVAVVQIEGGCEELAGITDSEESIWGEDGPPLAWDIMPIEARDFSPRELAKLSVGMKYGTHLAVVAGRSPNLKIVGIAR